MQRFKHILAIVDSAQPSQRVLDRAVALTQNNQAELSVICVVPQMIAGIGMPEGGPISAQVQAVAVAEARQRLEDAVERFRPQVRIHISVLVGTPFLQIIREVLRGGHDLVIKAPENPEWLERLFGSDDMHLLRKCPCPVWLVKDSSSESYRRILAAVDVDSDHPPSELKVRHKLNIQILEMAVSLALSDFAELHVAHAWQPVGESAMRGPLLSRPHAEVEKYVEQVRRLHDQELNSLFNEVLDERYADAAEFLAPQKHLIKGLPRKEIPVLAKSVGADLVVMGTVARTGVPGLFIGNTAETILEQIECSVLAVKPEGFSTPVTLES